MAGNGGVTGVDAWLLGPLSWIEHHSSGKAVAEILSCMTCWIGTVRYILPRNKTMRYIPYRGLIPCCGLYQGLMSLESISLLPSFSVSLINF